MKICTQICKKTDNRRVETIASFRNIMPAYIGMLVFIERTEYIVKDISTVFDNCFLIQYIYVK